MTNEHAIDVIKHLKKYYNDKNEWEDGYIGFDNEDNEAIDLAIKALEQLQDVHDTCKNCIEFSEFKQQPSEDCISREEVQDLISRWLSDYLLDETREALETINYKIGDMPPVIPQRKMGRWINKFGKEQGYDIAGIKTWYIQIMCDKCGFIKTAIEGHTGQYKYCPNCGAEMGGGEDEVSD